MTSPTRTPRRAPKHRRGYGKEILKVLGEGVTHAIAGTLIGILLNVANAPEPTAGPAPHGEVAVSALS